MLELAEASFTNHLSMCCREVLAENVADLEEEPIFAKLSGEDLYQVLQITSRISCEGWDYLNSELDGFTGPWHSSKGRNAATFKHH